MKMLLIACATLAATAAGAQTAQFVVTISDFSGPGSLSEAMQLAEAAVVAGADGARIEFDFAESTQITFDNELFVSLTFDEGSELTIDGGNRVILSGGGASRLFVVDGQRGLFPDLDGPSGQLVLENLTLRDGFSDDTGGAIFTDGTVTIRNALVLNNRAIVDDDVFACLFDLLCDGGGAVFVGDYGILLIENSEFRSNQVRNGVGDYGGAISNLGAMAVANSLFFDNSAGTGGGAIGNAGLAVIFGTRFNANFVEDVVGAFDGGGAIQNGGVGSSLSDFQQLILIDTEFDGNFTVGIGVSGGAMVNNGSAIVMRSLFANNVADGSVSDGGAIANFGGNLVMFDSTLSGNRVTGRGQGGALYTSTGPVALVHVTMTGNEVGDSNGLGGGGLYTSSNTNFAVDVVNSLIFDNRNVGFDGQDVAGVVRATNSVINDPTGFVLDVDNGAVLGDGAGSIVTGVGLFPSAALVAPLADNGGPTRTQAIDTPASAGVPNPLLDTADVAATQALVAAIPERSRAFIELAGVDLAVLTDQRGVVPVNGDRNDIGAYERVDLDSDGDGVADSVDNCREVANALQVDADADGFGNRCDPDLNSDGIVNVVDLGLLRARFFSADAVADFNVDGAVNIVDLGILRSYFFLPPGP